MSDTATHDGGNDYVLIVHYGDEDAVRLHLSGYSPGDAETARQALISQVEHANSIEAPYIVPEEGEMVDGEVIEPARVTGVDLEDPDDD